MKTLSIESKVIAGVVVVTLLVAGGTAAVVRAASRRNVELLAAEATRSAQRAFTAMERADVEKLDAALAVILASPALAEAFLERDRGRLLAVARPIFEALEARDVTHLYFHTPDRRVFLRVHKPEQFGDVVGRATLAQAAEGRGLGAGLELGQTAFALRAVRPWMAGPGGEVIGYVELGEETDHFLGRMKAQSGDDFAIVLKKQYLDAAAWKGARAGKTDPWDAQPDRVVVAATAADPGLARVDEDFDEVPEGGQLLEPAEAGGRSLVRGVVMIEDAAGRHVGGLVVQRDITDLRGVIETARVRVWALLVGSALALGAGLVLLLRVFVFRRIALMVETMQDLSARLAGGEFDLEPPPPGPPDELGRFEHFFGRFLKVVGGLLKELTADRTG